MGSVMARTAGAGLALCIGALCANGALGQSQRPSAGRLGEMLFEGGKGRKAAVPPVARYEAEGAVAFIFDRSSGQPLLRFEGSNEVWALTPQVAPRGDVIFKNDVGETVLRLSRLGGLTVFTAARPEGAAAALDGVSRALRPPSMETIAASNRMKAASDKASQAVRRQIWVEAPDLTNESVVSLAVDAAVVAVDAFVRVSKSSRDAPALARIGRVLVVEGDKPSATVNQRTLVITIVPERGVAGRPSSAKIMSVLRG
jgi:hypothetical protein